MGTYFLTGVTGVVGTALLSELLADPGNQLYVLIRPGPEVSPADKLLATFAFLGLVSEEYTGRVHILAGDMCKPQFGLSSQDYRRVASTCTHLIHCAGNVKSNLPREEAERIAVGSVRNLVELAHLCRTNGQLEKVELLSTIGVGGRAHGAVTETPLGSTQDYHNSYEWAKAQAEQLAWQGIDDSLPITIHRPSMIVGSSTTGQIRGFQVFYYICDFLSGTHTAGLLPDLARVQLDIVPVDFVARTILWSSSQRDTAGAVLHLCSGPEGAIGLGDLLAYVQSAYVRHSVHLPRVRALPVRLYKALIPLGLAVTPKRHRRRLRTLYFFLDYLSENIVFENERTQAILRPAGILIPQADSYMDRVMDYYLTHRT